MKPVPALIEEYSAWVRDKTVVRELDRGWHEVTTPFVDRHNDLLQIYVRRTADGILISDDGYTIGDLADSGCDVDSSPKRKAALATTLNGFGVRRRGNALEIECSDADFPLKKHSLIQSMLAVGDLFVLAQPNVKGLFIEDVFSWLEENDIRFSPYLKLSGIGFDHVFEAVIPRSKHAPERLIKTLVNPNLDKVQSTIFAWNDIRDTRPQGSKLITVVNDKKKVPVGTLDAFDKYQIGSVLWSERNDALEFLAA